MSNSNTIQLTLKVKDDGSVVIDQAAGKIKNFGRTAQSSMNMAQQSILSLKNMLISLGAVVVLHKLAVEINEVINAASNLEEATNKFSVVFKGQEEIARSWAETLVESYAMSRREAMQYLSSMQDLFVPMGMAADLAGKLSFEIVKLAADLGSFNNQTTEQVMMDMQSALVGNYETMKKYGVVLNETTVGQTALAMGLAKTKDEITAADKAQAAYALIVQGSQAAIGDMTRTSGSYANQMKQLRANIEDLKASIGEKLLPIATEFVTKINEWIKNNEKLLGQEIGNWLQGIARNLKESLPYLKTFAQYLDSIYGISLEGQIIKTEESLRKLENQRKNLLARIFSPIPGELIDQEIARLKKELASLYEQAYFKKPPKKEETTPAPATGTGGTVIPSYDPDAEAREKAREAIDKQIEALKTQAKTFGMAAKEAALYKLALEGATTEQLKQAAAILDTLAVQDVAKKKQADIESIQKQVEALKTEAATYGMTAREITLYKLALDGATPAQLEQARAILDTLAAQDSLNRSAEEGKRLMEEGKSVYESTRTATEEYAETIDKLNKLLSGGFINQDTYNRAVKQAGEELSKEAEKTQTVWGAAVDAIDQSLQSGLFDSFKDGVGDMKDVWLEMCDTLVTTFLRAIEQMAINELLYGTIAGKGDGKATGGLMGWLEGLFGGNKKNIGENKSTVAATESAGAESEKWVSSLTDKFDDFFSSFFSKIQGWFSSLSSWFSGLFSSMSNGLSSLLSSLGSMFGGGGGGGFNFGGILSSIGGLFGFAEGGWIPEPVLGRGMTSGRYYSFAENESERVMTKKDLSNINRSSGRESSPQRPVLNARIINVLDPSIVGNYLSTDAGEQIIMNIVKRNQGALAH